MDEDEIRDLDDLLRMLEDEETRPVCPCGRPAADREGIEQMYGELPEAFRVSAENARRWNAEREERLRNPDPNVRIANDRYMNPNYLANGIENGYCLSHLGIGFETRTEFEAFVASDKWFQEELRDEDIARAESFIAGNTEGFSERPDVPDAFKK